MRPELNQLVEKAMAEPEYLQRLMANPAEAAREAGVELTEEELAQIKPLNLADANSLLDAQKAAGC
ncbi:MAG TPA: Os1348 family NHLP clan protein [Symbiobacteriaceae bacterium]|nr:Os1348 family NHLP clan protein [Symbiobacteriaceae bacterium]